MSFADVLLRVMPAAENELERLAVAVDLTQRLTARLDGVFISDFAADKADWARSLFERAVSRSSLETTWRVVDGRSDAALLYHARRSDLIILPSCTASPGGRNETSELLALESGRPTLILPTPAGAVSIGHTVLIAWNDTRESARAVHDAMPILLNADRVLVLTVLAEDDPEPLVDRRLVEHLRQHGVSVELDRRRGDASEEIAAETRRLDADILVIGLSSEGEGPQRRLGEVSQRFIRTASRPVFCSH